jgi:hypothetical protein
VRKWTLFAAFLLVVLTGVPGHGQDTETYSRFNLHFGAGIGIPAGPTANFAGKSGTFQLGGGPNLNKHSSIVGEFMWHGLPPTPKALGALVGPSLSGGPHPSADVLALTANYMYHIDRGRYGFYVIGGGGWYYRSVSPVNFSIAPGTACQPVSSWWGFACQNGLVSTQTALAARTISSGGVNGGGGLTINPGLEGVKFYVEARYHYSPQGGGVSTQIVPVTFGVRW